MNKLILSIIAVFFSNEVWASNDATEHSVEISLQRTSAQEWRVRYTFSSAIDAFRVYPAELGFRQRSWSLNSEGAQIDETAEGAVITINDEPFDSLEIGFRLDHQYEDKTYVPVLPYSDGGAAVYSGHFSGDVMVAGDWQSIPSRFTATSINGESTVLPAWASESSPVYVYFGSQVPLEADQVVMVADQDIPAWLLESLEQTVPLVTATFSKRLGHTLIRKPLVFLSAGTLRDQDGYSVKGAGLQGQFTVMLSGTGLLIGSREREQMFQKMLAHELLHVWQQSMPGGQFNEHEPWMHEGSADALAVQALGETGLWSEEEINTFHQEQEQLCSDSLGESSLAQAATDGNWSAIYACGYLEFASDSHDSFDTWVALTRKAWTEGRPYSQAMLDALE